MPAVASNVAMVMAKQANMTRLADEHAERLMPTLGLLGWASSWPDANPAASMRKLGMALASVGRFSEAVAPLEHCGHAGQQCDCHVLARRHLRGVRGARAQRSMPGCRRDTSKRHWKRQILCSTQEDWTRPINNTERLFRAIRMSWVGYWAWVASRSCARIGQTRIAFSAMRLRYRRIIRKPLSGWQRHGITGSEDRLRHTR